MNTHMYCKNTYVTCIIQTHPKTYTHVTYSGGTRFIVSGTGLPLVQIRHLVFYIAEESVEGLEMRNRRQTMESFEGENRQRMNRQLERSGEVKEKYRFDESLSGQNRQGLHPQQLMRQTQDVKPSRPPPSGSRPRPGNSSNEFHCS